MFEPLLERPGYVSFVDDNGRRHTVSVFDMGKPQVAGPSSTYLKFTHYKNLFVRCSLEEVKAAIKRARTLRLTQIATSNRRQLEFEFDKETAVQLPTETAAANTHQADEAHNGGS
jgi:hypothetical protein